ncbi:MAG TPA: hypothetical protein VI198_04925 [Candidatus Eisenbacteria bacterium]
MSHRWKVAPLILAAVALVASPPMSFAQGKMRFGISGFGGYNSYKMDDVNDQIDLTNADPDVTAAGISMDKISNGLSLGGGLHAWVTKDFLCSLEYERLMASSKDEGNSGGSPVTVELKVPANAFLLTGAYLFPSTSKARFGLGAGLGYYSTSGTLEISAPGITLSDEAKGNGIGFHLLGVMDYAASSQVHLGVRAGYRMAKTSDLEDSTGDKLENVDGSKSQADWSGVMARVGLTLLLGRAD